MGRLDVFSCNRGQWDVKSQFYRTKIEHGVHLKYDCYFNMIICYQYFIFCCRVFRETADLNYGDIKSPFIAERKVDQVGASTPQLGNFCLICISL